MQLSLTEKFRPSTLSKVVGQSFAVMQLTDFADMPFPQAFLFAGKSGVGKTSAALALANDPGVNREWNLIEIDSGEMDAEAVEKALKTMRGIGVNDGWKLICCNEADMMSTKARQLWLSALERIQSGTYGKTVIVFTTNNPEKFDDRFRDRCEVIEFESDAKTLHVDAEALLADLWWQEGLQGVPPRLDTIRGLVVDGAISFRRLVRFVETASRKPVKAEDLASARLAKIAASKPVTRKVEAVIL
jgi:replication-associated recombination protein RarA